MAKVRLFLAGERVGAQLARSTERNKVRVLAAERGAARDVVHEIETSGRADIRQAGRFSGKWTSGFRGRITEGGGFIKVDFTMSDAPPMRHWRVFEFGATIRGKPMLWIPLSFARDAQGVRARDYPGRLFRVNRKVGAPLLLAAGRPAAPKYFGKAFVRIPRKFHLRDIIREGASKMASFYRARMKKNG